MKGIIMERVKDGLKTSEFWVLVLTGLGLATDAIIGAGLFAEYPEVSKMLGFMAMLYATLRTAVKAAAEFGRNKTQVVVG